MFPFVVQTVNSLAKLSISFCKMDIKTYTDSSTIIDFNVLRVLGYVAQVNARLLL